MSHSRRGQQIESVSDLVRMIDEDIEANNKLYDEHLSRYLEVHITEVSESLAKHGVADIPAFDWHKERQLAVVSCEPLQRETGGLTLLNLNRPKPTLELVLQQRR